MVRGQLSAWVRKAEGNTAKVIRGICFELSTRIIVRTPVDTGLARANWMPNAGSPDLSVTDSPDGGGNASTARLTPFLSGYDPGTGRSFFLTNAVNYIIHLENGHSQQAPHGMVELTVAEFAGVASQVVSAVSSGGGDL